MINKKDECHVKKCIPSIIPITLELLPKIKMCISKPEIHLVNNAICKPFKSKSKKKLRNHTPINQLSKFAKNYLI